MKNVSQVSQVSANELTAILEPITKSSTVSITYLVDDNRSKQKQGKKQVQKLVTINNVYLNHNYAKKVAKLTGKKFVAESLEDYGKFRVSTTIVGSKSTGAMMLMACVLKAESVDEIRYFHNGVEITEKDAEKGGLDLWAGAYYKPKVKSTKGRGSVSVEDDFGIISPYISRIKKIKIQGQKYEVVS